MPGETERKNLRLEILKFTGRALPGGAARNFKILGAEFKILNFNYAGFVRNLRANYAYSAERVVYFSCSAKADHGSKNSAAFSPRKILKRQRRISINFKNGAEFY